MFRLVWGGARPALCQFSEIEIEIWERGWTYGVVVTETDIAIYIYASLTCFDDGWDKWLSVQCRGLDEYILLCVSEGGEPDFVLRVVDCVMIWCSVRLAADHGDRERLMDWMRDVGCHFFMRCTVRGIAFEAEVFGVVKMAGYGFDAGFVWLWGNSRLDPGYFAGDVVVVVRVVGGMLWEKSAGG